MTAVGIEVEEPSLDSLLVARQVVLWNKWKREAQSTAEESYVSQKWVLP
jgi:hypothetical protein